MRNALAAVLLLTPWPLLAATPTGRVAEPKRETLVVVAPERFHQALRPFVAEKAKHRPTELAALESILKGSKGADDPEKLKTWLYRAWKERSVGYVLLVGDADVLPVRYMVLDRVTPAAFDYAFYPSDLYYADVARRDGSFDDWNGRKDGFHAGYFGEVRGEKNKTDPINYDAIDYRPELAVGRWPVSTPEEVKAVAAKSLKYEAGVRSGKAPGLRKAALVGVGGWIDPVRAMNGLAGRLPGGWTPVRLTGGKGPEASTEANVVKALNDGASVVFHVGHGFDEGWDQSLTSRAIARLKNADRLPVVLSAGCSTARFATLPPYEPYVDVDGKEHKGSDHGEVFTSPPPSPSPYPMGRYNPTGLGERLVRSGPNGAVAYIGCNTGGQPCGVTLLDGFARALAAQDEPTVGGCWASAVSYYYDAEHLATISPTPDWYPASIFFQGMKYMLFGDPSLPLPKAGAEAVPAG